MVPAVRLEFGIRNEPWPAHDDAVIPYVNAAVPGDLVTAPVRVPVLDGERTFWEKATILHLEAHREHVREQVRAGSNRLSRHDADLAASGPTRAGRPGSGAEVNVTEVVYA